MNKSKYLLAICFWSATLTVAACGQSQSVSAPAPPAEKQPAATTTAAPEPGDDNRFSVGGREFVLENNAGQCRLVVGEQKFDLGIPWQCDFHRAPDRTVRIYPRDFYAEKSKYPKKYRAAQIFLIEHSTAAPDNPKDCRTQIKAVRVNGDKVTVSKTPSKLASCPPFQWEDKNFTGVFE